MITEYELAAMIVALHSQPHLSMKEEKYLAIMKELLDFKRHEEHVEELRQYYRDGCL